MSELTLPALVEAYFSSLIIAFAEIYIWNKLLKSDHKVFSLINIITAILISFVITINYFLNSDYIKVIVSFVLRNKRMRFKVDIGCIFFRS